MNQPELFPVERVRNTQHSSDLVGPARWIADQRELVEALRETLNIATSISVAFNYADPDALTALGSARTVLSKYSNTDGGEG